MDKNKKALLEYQAQCARTEVMAKKSMISCINSGMFEHFDMWKAKKEIDKVFEKTVLKTKH